MTEAEWLESKEPKPMLSFLAGKASDRKLRLFTCACCRRIWSLLPDERMQSVVDTLERYADGGLTVKQLPVPWPVGLPLQMAYESSNWGDTKALRFAADAVALAANRDAPIELPHQASQVAYYVAGAVAWSVAGAASSASAAETWSFKWRQSEAREYEAHGELLRDIFGNPFRPVATEPIWMTGNVGTIAKLAEYIYNERAFDKMALLADALEDAGCTEPSILEHCRSGDEHVRGCWVVDLLLGRE